MAGIGFRGLVLGLGQGQVLRRGLGSSFQSEVKVGVVVEFSDYGRVSGIGLGKKNSYK